MSSTWNLPNVALVNLINFTHFDSVFPESIPFSLRCLWIGRVAETKSTRDMSDPTTQSNYDAIATTDVELDWRTDFDTQTISGSAIHRLKVLAEDGVDEVMYVVFFFHSDDARGVM